MRFLALAGLAASASAFLVVPEVSKVEVEAIPADARDSWEQSLDLECPGCPVRIPHGGDFTTEMESHLQLKFEVDLEQGNRLLLNGFEIYPHADPFTKSLSAPHVVDMPEGADRTAMMRGGMMHSGSDNMMNSVDQLGFTLLSKTLPPSGSDDKFEHVNIDLQIIEVSNVFIDSIPSVHIQLVKDNAGTIAIDSIETADPEDVATTATDGHEKPKCESWFCSWMESLRSHWNHWRPHCGTGSKSHPHGPGPHRGPGHHKGPHRGGPHRGHHGSEPSMYGHHHRPHRTWGHLMRSIASHILLPMLIGIIAGVIMSSIGMLVGTFLVYVYRRFFRSSCPRRRAVLITPVAHEEKDGLIEHQEPPPSYEEGTAAEENNDTKV